MSTYNNGHHAYGGAGHEGNGGTYNQQQQYDYTNSSPYPQQQSSHQGGDGLRRRTAQPQQQQPLSKPQRRSSMGGSSMKYVKRLDMFPKVEEEYMVRTESGGRISLIAYGIIIILVIAEFYSFSSQRTQTSEHIKVDTTLGKRLRVNVNITFPALACEDLHVDAMDAAGDSQINIEDETFIKRKLHLDGTSYSDEEISVELNKHKKEQSEKERLLKSQLSDDYCGSCFGAHEEESDCCNTCDELLAAYKKKRWNSMALTHTAEQCVREGRDKKQPKRMTKGQGCNLSGYMTVNRVHGNFHIAMGEGIDRDGRHIHQFIPEDTPNFNASHIIHELSFGPLLEETPPLNGVTKIVTEETGTTGLFQYFIKVVPTTYKNLPKKFIEESKDEILPSLYEEVEKSKITGELETNRYFFTERFRPLMIDLLDDEEINLHKNDTTTDDSNKHDPRGLNPKLAGVAAGPDANTKGMTGSHEHHEHHHNWKKQSVLPGVFFMYEIYPFAVEITMGDKGGGASYIHLFIRLMAIIGGVFTMIRMIDSYLYSQDVKKKNRQGRF